LVLIDPSYEVKGEYASIANTVKAILHKNPKTVIMVWYPLLPDARHQPLIDGLIALDSPAMYRAELCWAKPGERGAFGTGQVILNIPYELEVNMGEALNWLAPVLGGVDGGWKGGFVHKPK
jgi:23S rRNA (adenine2030-N6)-methyltransferase